jgi:hypothetical protein
MNFRIAICAAAIGFAASIGGAQAAGCGGYVNLAVWGCAPWDNNPPRAGVTPGYRAPAPRPAPRPVVQPARPTIQPGGRLVTDNGAGLISNNRGGILTDGGSGLRR